jgi:hypothetical protein
MSLKSGKCEMVLIGYIYDTVQKLGSFLLTLHGQQFRRIVRTGLPWSSVMITDHVEHTIKLEHVFFTLNRSHCYSNKHKLTQPLRILSGLCRL